VPLLLAAGYWGLGGWGFSALPGRREKLDSGRAPAYYEFGTYALPAVLGGDGWCNWGFAVWLGWLPWEAAFRPAWWCPRARVSYLLDSLLARAIAAVQRQRPPFGACPQPRFGCCSSGIFDNAPAPQPAAGRCVPITFKRPAAAGLSETRVVCCATALPNGPVAGLLTITGITVASLDRRGAVDEVTPTPGQASLSAYRKAIGPAGLPLGSGDRRGGLDRAGGSCERFTVDLLVAAARSPHQFSESPAPELGAALSRT